MASTGLPQGLLGTLTSEALKKYQTAVGLGPTGLVDAVTFAALNAQYNQ